MPTSIQTEKFGTLDTSGRIPVFLSGEGADLKSNFGLGFTIGGTEYIFMPEDRVKKGTLSGNNGSIMAGFVNPDLSRNLQDKADYVNLANTQFGSWDAGSFIANQLGGSTKGYIAPKSAYQPIFDAGLVNYDASLTGPVQGIGQVDGKPVYFGSNGYVEPSGKYNYQQAIGQKIVGYTYSSGGGLLAQLGNELNKISPVIGYASIAYLTAVTGGALGSALMSSGAMTSAAAASAAASAAGATAAGAAAAGAAATAAATAVGTAVASVTAQVAMGVPVETAVKNAAVNAVAQTQMPGITAQIQQAVDSPAVASALANASTSYAATVAKGGTADAASKAALAGAAGSITQNLTGSKSAADAMKVIATGGSADKAAEAAALAFFNEQVASEAAKKRQETNAAAEASAQQAVINEQNRLDAEATAKAQADAQAAIDAEATAKAQADAQAKAQADAQAAIDAEAKQRADDEAERLRQAGLQENTNPLPTDTTTTPPVIDPTKPPTDQTVGDGTAVGVTTPHLEGSEAYKYDPVTDTYTFTSDDGSTITIDDKANPIGFTEATDTSWSNLTDTKTGTLRLPKLPSGKTPSVKAPVQRPSTTTPTATPTAQPDFLSSILGQQQQTPVTYQTVMPELAKVFYGGKDFSSTPQRLNAQGQLVQDNPLLPGSDFAQPASALAPQSNPGENDVTSMLAKILGGGGDSASQDELLKILGRG